MKTKSFYILCLIFLSCGTDRTEREIDLPKSEQIIPYLENLSINRLELYEDNLIVNDTLVQFNSSSADSINNSRWTAHGMTMDEWVEKKEITPESLTDLKKLMMSSKNLRVVREKEDYFFSEGSWIDADWGKAYSIQEISSKHSDFTFDQIREIKAISNRPNWYEYYAD